jgi:hypothetical protein
MATGGILATVKNRAEMPLDSIPKTLGYGPGSYGERDVTGCNVAPLFSPLFLFFSQGESAVIDDWQEGYISGALIVGIIAFLVTWVYAISTYGFFLGVGLGWIPAAVIGALVGALWPLVLLAAIGLGASLFL